MNRRGSFTVGQIAQALSVRLIGDPDRVVQRIAAVDNATSDSITFITGVHYLGALQRSNAGAVILPDSLSENITVPRLISEDPYLCYARLTRFWVEQTDHQRVARVHSTAVVDSTASIHPTVSIGANTVIGANVDIASHVHIGAGSFIGADSTIGSNTIIHPKATIMHGVTVGQACEIHPGAVLGADGFGWAPDQGGWEKIHQLGGVKLGNKVSVGACTTIDRGALDDTVIEDGVILDNHIQVAHNVRIGQNTAIAGCTGIAGSTCIGRNCRIGGAVSIVGHISVCDDVQITANSFVNRSVKESGSYSSGFPLEESATWRKNAVRLHKLDEFMRNSRQSNSKPK